MKCSDLFFVVLVLIIHVNLGLGKPNDVDDDYDVFNGPATTEDEYVVFETTGVATPPTTRTTTRTTTRATTTTTASPETRVAEEYTDSEEDKECDVKQKCVNYYLCKEDGFINSDGSFLIDERLGPGGVTPPADPCPNMEMCCTKKHTIDNKTLIPEEICGSRSPTFKTPTKCGFRNLKGLGGTALSMQNRTLYSQYAEFPWAIAVMLNTKVGNNMFSLFKMGGSLIHPKVVLTAAHSIAETDTTKLAVRAGEWDTQSTNELCAHEERKVKHVITHEKFTRHNLQNDLALLVLEDEVKMTPFINTICLPPQNMNFDNQRCFSGGWGKNFFGKEGIYQVFMKKVELPIVPAKKCEEQLRKTRLGEDFELHDGFLCAGGEKDKDLCTGDGGSPLVCENKLDPGYYYQAGTVAGGIGCNLENVPGFYVQISKYRDWIDTKMTELGFGTRSYTM